MAGSTRQSRDVKKWLIARRAQYSLAQRFDKIDWEEDVLGPETEALLAGKVRLEIESGASAAAESIISVSVTYPEEEEEGVVDATGADEDTV